MKKKKKFTLKELEWARVEGAKLGVGDPEVFLEMRWSEVIRLADERSLKMIFSSVPVKP